MSALRITKLSTVKNLRNSRFIYPEQNCNLPVVIQLNIDQCQLTSNTIAIVEKDKNKRVQAQAGDSLKLVDEL